MLICLSDQFRGKVAQLVDNSHFRMSISNLLLGFTEGKHIFMMSRDLRKELENAFPTFQGQLKNVKKREQESQSLALKVKCSIEVTPSQDGPIERRANNGVARFFIPYGWFIDSERIQPTILVVENRRDGVIYDRVTSGYLNASGLNLKMRWMVMPGSGAGCADLFTQWAGARLLLCIVDTDRRSPNGPLGDTAAAVVAACRPSDPCEVYLLPTHEIENLLPSGLLEDVIVSALETGQLKTQLSQKLGVFQNLGVLGALGEFAFLDLKKGLTLGDIHRCKDKEQHEYLSSVAGMLQDKCTPPSGGFCAAAPRCANTLRCDCVIFEGWEILAHTAQYMHRLSNSNEIKRIFFSEAPPACQEAWRKIAERLVAWGCAFSKIAT